MRRYNNFPLLLLVSAVLLCLTILTNGSVFRPQESVEVQSVDPMKFVPIDYTEAFKGFSSDVVANEIFVEHSNTFGASASYTFGLGQLLANINERMFNLPNDGIDEALRTNFGSITSAYKDMTESLIEDSKVYSTSSIYTSNRTLESTAGIKAMMTNVYYQDFSQPHVAVPSINSRISIQTFGKIFDKLIPKGGWYGPSIYSFTKGIFINTFFYKNKFLFPFTDVGKSFFGTDRVRMLATGGTFKIRRTQEFTSITLPFKDKRKSLVLVLPKGELQDMIPYLDNALDNKKQEGFIETRPLIVQIPALNFTISNEYFSQMFYMGVNNSMCNWNDHHPFFLQPPAQSLYYYLDTDKFEVAAATGAQLNNNQEFQDITGIKPVVPIQEFITQQQQQARQENVDVPEKTENEDNGEDDDEGVTTNAPVGSLRSSLNLEEDDEDGDEESDEDINGPFSGPFKQYKFLQDEGPVETIRFDKPFYFYLQDEVLGPVYVGIVNSFKTYKDQVSSIEDGFDDMFKYQFWSCGPKHLALIDMFKSPLPPSNDDHRTQQRQGEEEDD